MKISTSRSPLRMYVTTSICFSTTSRQLARANMVRMVVKVTTGANVTLAVYRMNLRLPTATSLTFGLQFLILNIYFLENMFMQGSSFTRPEVRLRVMQSCSWSMPGFQKSTLSVDAAIVYDEVVLVQGGFPISPFLQYGFEKDMISDVL